MADIAVLLRNEAERLLVGGDYCQALARFEQLADMQGLDAKLANDLAAIHVQLGQYQQALSLFKTAALLGNPSLLVGNLLGLFEQLVGGERPLESLEQPLSSSSSPKRRVLLHIGTHKTGTTAIQDFCWRNIDLFKADGLVYPAEFLIPERYYYGQHCLAWQLLGQGAEQRPYPQMMPDPLSSLRERLAQPFERLLLSSENFCRLDSVAIEHLASMLEGCEVNIIVYLRRQDEYLQSLYQTAVLHSGYTAGIDRLMGEIELDYAVLLKRWSDVFGRGHVHVGVYEKNRLSEGDIVRDFFSRLVRMGMLGRLEYHQTKKTSARLNKGYPKAFVECIRLLRTHVPDGQVESLMFQLAERVYRGKQADFGYLSPSVCRALCADYAAANARVAQDYLGVTDALFRGPEVADEQRWISDNAGESADLRRFLQDVTRYLSA